MKKPRAEVTKGKWLFIDIGNGVIERRKDAEECIKDATAYLNHGYGEAENVRVLRVIEEYEPVSTEYTFKKVEG